MSGQIIGFNITKIEAEKKETYSKPSINTNIEFINVEKEQIDIIKDLEVVKINFKFSISYTEKEEKKESEKKESGKINLEGSLLLSLEKEKAKQIQKEWKKKSLTDEFRIPLLNIIIKKCTTKALVLQEDLNLLPHIPIPHIKTTQNSN